MDPCVGRIGLVIAMAYCWCYLAMGADAMPGQVLKAPPPGGQWLVTKEALSRFGVGKHTHGHSEIVNVDGPGIKQALRLTVDDRGYPWDVEVGTPIQEQCHRGDVVLLHLWARALQTSHESGQGLVGISVGETHAPWAALVERLNTVGPNWQEFYIPGTLSGDYAPGELAVKLPCGQVPQVVEIGGIELISYGSRANVNDLPNTRTTYAGREPDAPWRADAQRRIEELRMAPFAVQVIDQAGKPVPGAQVRIRLLQHAFAFGCAVRARPLVRDDVPGNVMYRQRFLELFNAASFENDLKWEPWSGDWGLVRADALDALRWLHDHGIEFRGHVMVWPSFRTMPAYVRALKGKAAPEELERLVLSRIDDISEATAPYVSEWDVLNEPRDNHDLMDLCGRQVMVDWFKRAQLRLPGVRLALNESPILPTLTDGPTQQHLEETAAYLIAQGAPLDVLGFQGHFGGTVPGPQRILAVLDRFAKLGKSIRVTEYTIESDDQQLQADFTRDLLTVLFSHPSMIGFQMWGMEQAVRPDGSLTPLGHAFHTLVHETWRTDVTGNTDNDGMTRGRGFLGRYTITITAGGRKTEMTCQLRSDSAPWIVTLR